MFIKRFQDHICRIQGRNTYYVCMRYKLSRFFYLPGQLFKFTLEMLICLPHDFPGVNVIADLSLPYENAQLGQPDKVPVNNPWSLFMVFRIYLIIRMVTSRYLPGY